jgi:hypothetical protein
VSPFLYLERAVQRSNSVPGLAASLPSSPHLSLLWPPSLQIFHLIMLTSTPSQTQCRGCGRVFAPRGLSQHVSKSRDPRCQAALRTSRAQAASSSIQHTAMPPPLDPNNTVPISTDGEHRGSAYSSEGADYHNTWRV